jgi:hypothetical protein
MRIISWNCNNGINKEAQLEYFKSFEPDIAIIPELKQKNIELLNPKDAVWVTNNHSNPSPKGLGVLSFGDYRLKQLPRDEDMEIFIPLRVSGGNMTFNLLAFWNFYSACKQGRFKGVEGPGCLEYAALEHYKPLFQDPAIMAGDLNFGPTFSQIEFLKVVKILEQSGMKSLYHEYNGMPLSQSKNSTYITPRKNYHHIDHMFGSEMFYKNMKAFKIDDFKNVVLSDHAPLLLDVNIELARKKTG